MPTRICLVGCGGHSNGVHGPSLGQLAAELPDLELASCCDLDESRAAAYARRFGFRRHDTDLDAMIRRERPDALCLVAHVSQTCALGVRLLAYGIPLILEKPPGLDVDECDRLIEAAGDTPHMVAFNRRFVPLLAACRATIDPLLAPGDIHHIRYDFNRWHRPDEDFSTTAIHGIDAVRCLARADYRSLQIRYQDLPRLGPTVANIWLHGEMTSGAVVNLAFTPVSGVVFERAHLDALDHTFLLDLPIWKCYDGQGLFTHVHNGEVAKRLTGAEAGGTELHQLSGFYGENRAFIEGVRAGKGLGPTLADSRQSVAVAQAVRERRRSWPG